MRQSFVFYDPVTSQSLGNYSQERERRQALEAELQALKEQLANLQAGSDGKSSS
ncbi:hypothetical protein [Synechococcus sp. PCC 6312]|uniref:hypothetical protein n=1 Tax=Synechococcus sp. (strain ATCC 27167 / PCC 6312) TaxID=195253 RepID=UPI00029F327F|nr:hypothetical protein [Synechococcus sp. PCC 6312]AFY61995.1 hypothetical protein Syn6312_2935 [Synechococcus sp. PCC 6312]